VNVALSKLWMTNVVTGEMFSAQTVPGRSQSFAVGGSIRTYAGGRQRAIGSTGASGSWKFSLAELSLTQAQTLRAWMATGVTVLARDHRGQSMYGTFFAVELDENFGSGTLATYVAAIELLAVDVVEGV
jgi:hypothetical protein